MSSSPLDLDHDTMRRLGRRVADVVAEHLATLREQPVRAAAPRGETRGRIGGPPPERGTDFETLLARLRADVFPLHAREPHPGFMGFVPGCPTFPGVLGDWLATGHNFFAGVWTVAAGPNEVEMTVLDWMRGWLGMPAGAGGILTSGGSAATLTAIVAARHAAIHAAPREIGRLALYTSEQAHSSVERAAWIAGVPREQVAAIPTDDDYCLRVDALAEAVWRDREAGLIPFAVVATAGTTNTGAVDPLGEVADLCEREGLWMHVDAAYAGFAALTGRGRAALAGIERAHSITLDPHKWLFVPFECGCLLARDPRALGAAYRVTPEYLRDVERAPEDQEVNFADYGGQLTRYARALKVWLAVSYFGTDAIAAEIERGIARAELAERLVRAEPALEVLSPARLAVLCFRARGWGQEGAELDALNERINARVNATGRFLISSTRLRGAFSMRICPLGFRTTDDDIRAVVAAVLRAAGEEQEQEQKLTTDEHG
ncbi:MAG TPA: pyridoxal-dependent decarboxylase [Gemmatimonadaceae bacterium]|nr:pyridoxal-dependent decarboxylase [Gemmatimonadaceae bacterium]